MFNNNLNIANIGFCISEKLGIYVANSAIIGFKYHNTRTEKIIVLYTTNYRFKIYTHTNEDLDFNVVSKKIIIRIIDSIRYDINTNINVDKIIDEVINCG